MSSLGCNSIYYQTHATSADGIDNVQATSQNLREEFEIAGMEKVDLVVIGAGWHGLIAAKTYLEVNPTINLVLLEEASTLGGVWAKHRLYPGLKSNNLLGTYEYSDYPLDKETYGVREGQHLPAEVVHRYLANYAKEFGVYERIHFNNKVESAERKDGGGWLLTISGRSDNSTHPSQVFASKLIVATGLTSDPFIPILKGSESFDAPLFHFKDFKDNARTVDTAKNVVVLGGAKSAFDTVYAYASKGVQVDWIIRESGQGPVWMAPPYVTPLKKWLEKLTQTRFLTWFSPCIWGDADGYSYVRSFLHGTAVGRFLVDAFWKIIGGDIIALNNYDSHPETAKLKPRTNPFFVGAGLAILNYDTNFFELVKGGKARVHIADVTGLSTKTVHLSNGESLPTDALICCTGWKHSPPIKFTPDALDLSLPYRHGPSESSELIARADEEIMYRFPRLKDQPKPNPTCKPLKDADKTFEPEEELYRLYRFMVPPAFIESRDIAFAGSLLTISTAMNAQFQALWITAFFADEVAVDSDIKYSSVLHSRFMKWRAPSGFGARFPDMVFDALPYDDLLLTDLGLEAHRKVGAVAEIFSPYGPSDYRGLTREWLAKRAGGKVHIE